MAKFGDDFVSEYYRAKVGAAAEEMNGVFFLMKMYIMLGIYLR